MRPYAPTTMERATLTQETRVLIPPCTGAGHRQPSRRRHVQILTPDAPLVYIGLDVHPDDVGPNRSYKLPACTPSHPIEFDLLPGQWLVGASEVGLASVSVLVEYQEGE